MDQKAIPKHIPRMMAVAGRPIRAETRANASLISCMMFRGSASVLVMESHPEYAFVVRDYKKLHPSANPFCASSHQK